MQRSFTVDAPTRQLGCKDSQARPLRQRRYEEQHSGLQHEEANQWIGMLL
jgi:hypothetical protein